MGNLGVPEIMVILVIALLVFGPNKVPEMARQLGKGMREIRKIQDSMRSEVSGMLDLDDRGNRPTPPLHTGAFGATRPASVRAQRAAVAPSRFRTPTGGRAATPPSPAPAAGSVANAQVVARSSVPRVSAPSRFRAPRPPGAASS